MARPKIEMGKSYTTHDGKAVRVLCVDALGDSPVCALVREPRFYTLEARDVCLQYSADGQSFLTEYEDDAVRYGLVGVQQ